MADQTIPSIKNLRGNIGIGLANPATPLAVKVTSGNLINLGSSAPAYTLQVGSASSTLFAAIGSRQPNTSQSGLGIMTSTPDASTATYGDMFFSVRKNNDSDFGTTASKKAFSFLRYTTSLMTILRDGKVGIGTTSPSTPLHVKGNIRAEASGSTAFADLKSSQIYASSTYDLIVGTNNPLFFRTNDERRMTILGGGNVGIGTTSPAAKLHIDVTTEDNQPALRISKVSDQNENALEVYHGTTSSARGIADFENSAGSVLYVRGDGNVGIGTTSPSAKLHVVGGDIRTENRAFFAGRRSASEPSFSFHDDSDTGMFNIASNILAFATSGSERVRIASDGLVTFAGTGGGALTIGSHIDLGDNQQVRLGAGDDLTLYHEPSGENSYIDNSTGDLFIRNNSNDSVIIGHNANKGLMYVPDGRVELRFNDSKKFETTNDGVSVTGNIVVETPTGNSQTGHPIKLKKTNSGGSVQVGAEITATPYATNTNGGNLVFKTANASVVATTALTLDGAQNATFAGDVVISGGLTINGTTTTLNSTTLQIDDKNIELGTVATPSDTTADGGGITLKGASDYTIRWADGTNSWHFNQGITVGANGTGHDVVFYGDTSDRYLTWDQSADRLNLRDYVELTLGTHNDLRLWYNNVRGRIAYTGGNEFQISALNTLAIGFNDGTGAYGETSIVCYKDGAVKIKHDNSQKFTTDAGGITVTGKMTSDSIATGYANSLEMFASGVHNYISSQSSGSNLYIRNTGGGQILIRPKTGEEGIKLIPDGAVELYHDNALKLTTTAGGADIAGTFGTGHINLDGELNFTTNGSKYIDVYTLANSNTFNIRHHNPSGNLYEMAFQSAANGAATLYYNGGARFATTTDGIQLHGNGYVDLPDNGRLRLGTNNDMMFYHSSGGSGNNILDFQNHDGLIRNLANDKLFIFQTTSGGTQYEILRLGGNTVDARFSQHVNIGSSGTAKDLTTFGSTSARYMKWDGSADTLNFRDNVKATFGDSDDLDIYHDSSNNNNYIQANNGRNLLIESNGLSLRSQAGENMITATGDGAVSLYHDNTTRLGTTSSGVAVTGNLSASSLTVNGSPQAGEVRFSATGINSSTYTTLCTVAGDNLASIIDMTITGTSSNVVLNSSFEILVNHYQDIHVKSVSGDYSEVTLRITSDNNEDFSIEAKHNGSTTTTIEVCIFPRAGETITPTSTDPNYTGREYEHTATEGFRFGGTDGGTESSNLIVDGRIGIGTTSPTDTLEVQNNVGNPMLHLRPNAASTALNPIIMYRNQLDGSANYMLCEGTSTYFGTHHGGVPTDKSEMIRILPSSSDAPSLRIGDAGSAGANLQIGGNIKLLNNGDSYITGGDVGIGTTSPDSPLELEVATAGSTQTRLAHFDHNPTGNTGSGFLRLSSGSNNASSLHIEQVSSGGGSLYGTYSDTNFINNGTQTSGAYNNINFVTNEAIRMTIGGGSQAGKVGIGTTTPSRTLHVVDSAGPTIKFERSSNSNLEFQFGTTNASILGAGEIQFRANGGSTNKFVINNSLITSNATTYINADLGLGVSSPVTKLDVRGGVFISGNHTDTGNQLNVWCDSNGYGNLAVYNFCIKTGANDSRTNPFFISHIGSVGIGTTSINTGIKLQVAGGIYATTGYVYAKFIRADYFSSGQNLELQSGGSGKVQLRTSNNVQLEADNDGCTRLSHVGSTTGGKFLVRTYSENDYLSVFSTEYSSGALCMGYGAAGKYNAAGFVSTYDNFSGHKTILKINHNGINVLTTGSAATDTVGADLSMAERFRVEVGKSYFNNGPVGIGTTSPSTPLHIDHTGDKAITIESDGDTDSNFIFMKTSASTAQVYIGHETGTAGANFSGTLAGFAVFGNISSGMGTQFLTGGGNQHVKMTIRHSGQVGIGVNNPNSYYFSNLVVGDTTSGDHGITIRSSNAAKGVLAFADSDSGTGRYSGYIAYNHSTNDMEFYTLAGNFAMMIDDAQQVGIGTTSPNYLLDVEKSGAAMRVYNTDNNGQTDLHLRTAGTTGSSRIFFGDTAVSDIGSIIYRHNGNSLAFQTNGSERMRITGGSDGYVGIGTTSPQQELDVDGVIKQKVYTLSSLPSASSSTIGARAFISDSAVQYNSSNIGQQAAYGGGSYFVPVYSDGSYWYIG